MLREKKTLLKKLVKEKKHDKVLKTGLDILEKNPDDSDVNFIIGALYFIHGSFSKSLSHIDKVLEISSYDPDALILKANALFKLGKHDESKTCCEKILEIDSKNKDVEELLKKINRSQK